MIENVDKLTGLYVQRYFEKRLEEELARTNRYKRPLTLLLYQINYHYFTTDLNIRWGMMYTILKQFGSLLAKQLRNVDIAGRYGGEMFIVMLPETDLAGGTIVAERIRKAVESHCFIGDNMEKEIKIAVEGGIATSPIHGKSAQELISSAHQALLIAHNEGGNKLIVCPNKLYDYEGRSVLVSDSINQDEKECLEKLELEKDSEISRVKAMPIVEVDMGKIEALRETALKQTVEKKKEELKKALEQQIQLKQDKN